MSALAALVLAPSHVDIDVIGQLTAGDLIVGAGTLALAWFTWRLAKETHQLDVRTAERERDREQRRVRGVARLIDGELAVTITTLMTVIDTGKYSFTSRPHADESGRRFELVALPKGGAFDLLGIGAI
jgi:hypothetical protein